MATLLSRRRVVAVALETAGAEGTAMTLNAATDAVPLIRRAEFEIEPISVDRPTLRQSLTKYANIYQNPGKGIVTMTIEAEVAGPASGFPSTVPNWTVLFHACGFNRAHSGSALRAYRISNVDVDGGPMRSGEQLTITDQGGTANFAWGDGFRWSAGVNTTMFIDEDNAGGHAATGTILGATSGTQFQYDQRSTNNFLGYKPNSNPPAPSGGQRTATIEIFADGKKVKAKGCVGNCEFVFNHGDAVIARFEMRGVLDSYGDATFPTNANEGHKVPPTFLGAHFALSDATSAGGVQAPLAAARWGTGGGGSQALEGSLNQLSINTGNNIVLQENSIDPNGITFAFISERSPGGSFNPSELESSNFGFVSNLVAGRQCRALIVVGAWDHADANSDDGNSFIWNLPGLVFDGLVDQDRDGVNVWDASFRLGGGDYDASEAGEAVGNDNELVFVHV